MSYIKIILIVLIFACSCQTEKNEANTIEGDLYFKLIDFYTFKSSESELEKLENEIKTINKDTLNENDRIVYEKLEYMADHDLLGKPYVHIQLDNGDTKRLFLSNEDYKKLAPYNGWELQKINKKVRIKAVITESYYDSLMMLKYDIGSILSIGEIEGKTVVEK